jgi:Transposase DDE domain
MTDRGLWQGMTMRHGDPYAGRRAEYVHLLVCRGCWGGLSGLVHRPLGHRQPLGASRLIAWDESGRNDPYQLRWSGCLIRSSSDNQDDQLESAGCPEGYYGKRLAEAGQALGITVEAIARGRDGQFVPAGICWVVERSFAWLSRYRRLNTVVERSNEHLIAFVAIAFTSILSRRLRRLVVEERSA